MDRWSREYAIMALSDERVVRRRQEVWLCRLCEGEQLSRLYKSQTAAVKGQCAHTREENWRILLVNWIKQFLATK